MIELKYKKKNNVFIQVSDSVEDILNRLVVADTITTLDEITYKINEVVIEIFQSDTGEVVWLSKKTGSDLGHYVVDLEDKNKIDLIPGFELEKPTEEDLIAIAKLTSIIRTSFFLEEDGEVVVKETKVKKPGPNGNTNTVVINNCSKEELVSLFKKLNCCGKSKIDLGFKFINQVTNEVSVPVWMYKEYKPEVKERVFGSKDYQLKINGELIND